jgi:acyl-CoA thioesterase-1
MLRRTLLVLALFAAACSSGPQLPRLAPDAVVLAFGDSLTFGTGAEPAESYPERLQALIGRKVVSSGIPGEVSAAGLARLSAELDETRPQLVILCHGGNDLLRKLDDTQTANNVRAMVGLARAHGAAVVLIGVPKPGLLPSTAAFYADIAGELHLPYEGGALRKILADNGLKSDLVHPNAAGYARLAQAVADLLKKAGAV